MSDGLSGSSRWGVPLVTARFITMLGTGMAPVCLAAGGLGTPRIGASGLGVIMAGLVLGEVAFTLLGGVLADRVGAATAMACGDLLAFAAEGGIAFLFAAGLQTTVVVTALTFLLGVGAALSNPAGSALVRQICKDDELVHVNNWIRSAGVLARVLGAPVGGVIAATGQPAIGIGVDAVTFLCSGLIISLIATRRHMGTTRWRRGISVADVIAGWNGFRSIRWVLPAAIAASIVNGARNVGTVLVPAALALAGYSPRIWGIVFGIQMVGNVTALWTVAKVKSRHALAVSLFGVSLVGMYYLTVAFHAPLLVIGALAFLAGGSISNFGIRFDLTVQLTVPPEIMSRVVAVASMFSLILAPIAAGTVGLLVIALGKPEALALWGFIAIVAILLAASSKSILHCAEPRGEQARLAPQR